MAATPPDASGAPDAAASADAGADASADAGTPADAPLFPIDAPPTDASDAATERCATRALVTFTGGACSLDAGGQLTCWGRNQWGAVVPGGGSWVEPLPVSHPSLADVVDVASDGSDLCVVHRDGGVSCWGENGVGQVGDTPRVVHTAPFRVPGVSGADHVVMAYGLTCAHHRDGAWTCWGAVDTLIDVPSDDHHPHDVPAFRGARELTLGWPVTGIWDDGHVVTQHAAHDFRVLPGIDDAVDVASIQLESCVARRDGSVWCWEPDPGGRGTPPARVDGVSDIRRFARNGWQRYELCGIRSDGSLWCWTLAPGNPAGFAAVEGGGDVALAAMGTHLCAATCDGQVHCNGAGPAGENGDGVTGVPPAEVRGIADATSLAAGWVLRSDHSLAAFDRWPSPTFVAPCAVPASPMPIPGVDDALALFDACALRANGTVACPRGSFPAGEVTLTGATEPIVDFAIVEDIVFGGSSPAVVTSSGALLYWDLGPVGSGGADRPIPIAAPAPVAEIGMHALRTTLGEVYGLSCFAPFTLSCSVGAAWPGLTDATRLWQGAQVDCVARASGETHCRFAADALDVLPAALGIAVPAASTLVHVPALDGVAQIDLNGEVLCARSAGGAVDCWGDPRDGRLGANDVTVTHTRPVERDAVDLSHAADTCALRADGTVVCWGRASTGSPYTSGCQQPLDHRALLP